MTHILEILRQQVQQQINALVTAKMTTSPLLRKFRLHFVLVANEVLTHDALKLLT